MCVGANRYHPSTMSPCVLCSSARVGAVAIGHNAVDLVDALLPTQKDLRLPYTP